MVPSSLKKKVNKNSCCGETSFDSIHYQQLQIINHSETRLANARKVSSNPNFYYEDKCSYYHPSSEVAHSHSSPTNAGSSTHREEKHCRGRPAFMPSWTMPPIQFGPLHSSLHLFSILSVATKHSFQRGLTFPSVTKM